MMDGAISNFMMQALRGEPLTIYGRGHQTRSFCYVSDLIEGIMRLSRSDEHLPVNIGNPAEFTILECAETVLEVTGSDSAIRFEPLPEIISLAANRMSARLGGRWDGSRTLLSATAFSSASDTFAIR